MPLGVDFLLVTEGDGFKREDRFARFIHRLDLLLKTPRGADGAKVTCGIYLHYQALCDRCRINPCDKGIRLRSFSADADGVGLGSDTTVADIDVIIACREIGTSKKAQCDVAAAGWCYYQSASMPNGRIVVAGCVDY